MKMRLYIAGPMQGYPSFNFPLFDMVAGQLRARGYDVVNPAEHDRNKYPDIEQWPGFATGNVDNCPKFDLQTCLRWDFQNVMECDAIAMLPGWRGSSGARDERRIAERIGLKVYHVYFAETEELILVEDITRMGRPIITDQEEIHEHRP